MEKIALAKVISNIQGMKGLGQINPPASNFGEVLGKRQNLMRRLVEAKMDNPLSMQSLNPLSRNNKAHFQILKDLIACLLYTSPSPRDRG